MTSNLVNRLRDPDTTWAAGDPTYMGLRTEAAVEIERLTEDNARLQSIVTLRERAAAETTSPRSVSGLSTYPHGSGGLQPVKPVLGTQNEITDAQLESLIKFENQSNCFRAFVELWERRGAAKAAREPLSAGMMECSAAPETTVDAAAIARECLPWITGENAQCPSACREGHECDTTRKHALLVDKLRGIIDGSPVKAEAALSRYKCEDCRDTGIVQWDDEHGQPRSSSCTCGAVKTKREPGYMGDINGPGLDPDVP